MEKRNKNYWRPLWKGLVIDSEGKHFRRMKSSVWLFLYFVLKADSQTGFLRKNYEAISREMGVKKRTVRYWLKNLQNKGYVSIQRRNGFCICVRNWKTFGKSSNPVSASKESDIILPLTSLESDIILPLKGQNFATLGNRKVEKTLYLKEKTKGVGQCNRYDNKYINNVNRYNCNEFNSLSLTKEELLAQDLAKELKDTKSLRFYLSIVKKYPESFLRKILSKVKQTPISKIKRSRGALFNYLLKNYEKRKKNHCH